MNYLKYTPNIITCLRIILVWPFLWALLQDNYILALSIFIIAGCSDGLDGCLARKYNWISYFGSFADPLADKLLMISSFFALTFLGHISFWLMSIVVLRDLIIMSGVAFFYYRIGPVNFKPTLISKINTIMQIVLVSVVLFELSFVIISTYISYMIQIIVILLTIISLIQYINMSIKEAKVRLK